jgi:hypothetical protein
MVLDEIWQKKKPLHILSIMLVMQLKLHKLQLCIYIQYNAYININ